MQIKATADTPEVHFEASTGELQIKGRSLPEDAWSFYKPLIEWAIEEGQQVQACLKIVLHLDYFNSSSGRFLLEMLAAFESRGEGKTEIFWVSDDDDELMQEKGEEFSDLLNIPFRFTTV